MEHAGSEQIDQRETAYLDEITVRVPRETPWQPTSAQQMMQGLFALNVPVSLLISRLSGSVNWQIEVPHRNSDTLVKLLYSFYPHAQVTVAAKQSASIGYHVLELQGAAPFIAPLKYAEEDKRDNSMRAILGALTDLRPAEHVEYRLTMKPITEEHYELGQQMLTASTVSWWHYLRPRWAARALISKALGWDKVERFVPEIQRVAEAKLRGPLKQASLRLKIRAQTKERAAHIGSLLEPAFAAFEREGFNFLVPAQPDSYPLVLSPPEVAALWHPPTEHCQVPGIRWAPSAVSPPAVELLEQSSGVLLGLNRYQGQDYKVYLPYPDRVTHINLIGKTRTGKSTLMHRMAYQDTGAGHSVIVIDRPGDLVYLTAASISNSRENDAILMDVANRDHVFGLNLLAVPPGVSTEVAANKVLSIFHKMFPKLRQTTRTEDALYAALSALISFGGTTLLEIPRLFSDAVFRRRVLAQVQDPVALEFWQRGYEPLSESHQREIARPVNNRVRRFYRNETLRRMVCQPRCLDFREILDGRRIFLATLRGTTDLEAEVLGALLISKIQMAAMSRTRELNKQGRPTYVYIDEAQNFVTTSLPRLFSEAGKHGISLVLANQYLNQLTGETLDAVLGNVGTTVVFRVGHKDARVFQGITKPHFSSANLENLSRFNAVVKMQLDGETLPAFSMKTLPPLPLPEEAKERVARIRERSRQEYTRDAETVDAEIRKRFTQTTDEATHGGMTIEEVDFSG